MAQEITDYKAEYDKLWAEYQIAMKEMERVLVFLGQYPDSKNSIISVYRRLYGFLNNPIRKR